MDGIKIRTAQAADIPVMLDLVRQLALFERDPDAVKATEADLLRDGFGPVPRFHCRLAEQNGEAVGFTLYFYNYSTWVGRVGIWLEDFFVTDQARGTGVGGLLLADLAAIACAANAGRLDLAVLEWNPARLFYESQGMYEKTDWRLYRIEGTALQNLAAKAL